MPRRSTARLSLLCALLASGFSAHADTPPMQPDIPASFDSALPANANYVRRVAMIPMRDGVRLHTIILMPKGAAKAPIMLTRTPYNAARRSARALSPDMATALPEGDDQFIANGYIRVYQDVRGKHGSEGDYVMTRPIRGPLNGTAVDHVTDAYDTIDWLVKNVPETNGKVGMVGSSYDGFTVLMALADPHPALKAAVPMSPMVDGWRGDDWFHNGAFRMPNLFYFASQTTARGSGAEVATGVYDDYEGYLRAGSVGGLAQQLGVAGLPYVKKVFEHPAYDSYWQGQALDRVLGSRPLKVPTMHVVGRWDQEDIYGAYAVYAATEPKDRQNDMNHLVVGPWRHSQVNYEGRALGPLRFDGDTAAEFRRETMLPFLNQHLKDGAPRAQTPPVLSYETGTGRWRRHAQWPLAQATTPLYLAAGGKLGFDKPARGAFDEFVSDPSKPVPFVPRPVRATDPDVWRPWLVSDQRFVADRPDVLTWVSEPLKSPVHLAGAPMVNLFASTTGTDADWVVKVIDVYPDEVPNEPRMGGYQLGISMDIFRGRYRNSLETPSAIPANKVERYRFALPNADHVFLPGHRIMVQVQSSWFPLYDRNPQTFVPNIFLAQPADYRKAVHRVYSTPDAQSVIELPVVQ
ncbi:CocE/NonD family hydrolase [Pseudoduganella sp. GCM10020061]|uniref:CocE/NonD family hydrolase n=1 Tax=Pseudoduganella sp. GCM10020061 TaxID=3317345 RepID=UPI0036398043